MLQNRPITTILITIMTLIFFKQGHLFDTSICSNTLANGIQRSFIHGNTSHLVGNMISFYYLSTLEEQIGSGNYLFLLGVILSITVLLEYSLDNTFNIPCSVGFSGILFALLTYQYSKNKNLNMGMLASVIISVLEPSLKDPRASLIGHGVGALTGLIISRLI